MAVNAYLVIDGVDGQSQSMKNAIDIESFSFGSALVGADMSSQESRHGGRPNLSDITVTKMTDSVSPTLWQHCISGDYLKKVEVIYTRVDGKQQVPFFKVILEMALITSWQVGASTEHPQESLSLTFKKISLAYASEAKGAEKGFITKTFDMETLKDF
jgi:type VI secretion system secreted protein Hcp